MTLKDEKDKFCLVAKRILKSELTTNEHTLNSYKENIITAYNDAINFVNKHIDRDISKATRDALIQFGIQSKFQLCLTRLNCSYEFSDSETIQLVDPLQVQIGRVRSSEEQRFPERSDEESENFQDADMTMTPADFIAFAAKTITKNYAGDPLALTAFVNSLNLVNTIAGTAHADLFVTFILTKLEGVALEAIREDVRTVNGIVDALKAKIKPESSKVVSARLMSLRLDRSKTQDFCKNADELAENFLVDIAVHTTNRKISTDKITNNMEMAIMVEIPIMAVGVATEMEIEHFTTATNIPYAPLKHRRETKAHPNKSRWGQSYPTRDNRVWKGPGIESKFFRLRYFKHVNILNAKYIHDRHSGRYSIQLPDNIWMNLNGGYFYIYSLGYHNRTEHVNSCLVMLIQIKTTNHINLILLTI